MIIVATITEAAQKGTAATTDFVWMMAEDSKLHVPHAVDTKKSLFKYANSTSVSLPFHVAVDLRTMKLVKASGGKATASSIEQLALSTLGP